MLTPSADHSTCHSTLVDLSPPWQPELRTGDAAGEIIDAATESAGDLIIVGSRGQTGLKHTLPGSVARNVRSGSNASVLVVRAAPEA